MFNAAGDERSGTRFWMSSVLNETVVHGFDAANAADRPADIDADVAAALISNHLAMLTSPTWEMQRSESAHAIRGTGQGFGSAPNFTCRNSTSRLTFSLNLSSRSVGTALIVLASCVTDYVEGLVLNLG